MKITNLSENLMIFIASVAIGGYVGYKASTASNKQTIELLRPTIEEAISKETTSISNEFKTDIKKLKNRKGELTIDVKPIIENQIDQDEVNTITQDSILKPEKKKGFLGRLFSKKDKTKKQ